MTLKDIPGFVWVIPVALLLLAISRMPYGYYTFLRIVVFGSALLFAYVSWQPRTPDKAWAVGFVLIAILFNPLAPVHLNRHIWFYLDLICAAVFAAHLILVKLRAPIDPIEAKNDPG